jgi:hypothetical protein
MFVRWTRSRSQDGWYPGIARKWVLKIICEILYFVSPQSSIRIVTFLPWPCLRSTEWASFVILSANCPVGACNNKTWVQTYDPTGRFLYLHLEAKF